MEYSPWPSACCRWRSTCQAATERWGDGRSGAALAGGSHEQPGASGAALASASPVPWDVAVMSSLAPRCLPAPSPQLPALLSAQGLHVDTWDTLYMLRHCGQLRAVAASYVVVAGAFNLAGAPGCCCHCAHSCHCRPCANPTPPLPPSRHAGHRLSGCPVPHAAREPAHAVGVGAGPAAVLWPGRPGPQVRHAGPGVLRQRRRRSQMVASRLGCGQSLTRPRPPTRPQVR